MLILYFRQGDFLEMMTEEEGPIPLEKDGALPLAQAFARACESLSPDVAFIVTHLDQASLEWIESRAQWVESGDADQLANERIGLLYLSEEMSRHWTSDPILDNRDEMHVKKGRLLFSGRDSSRWW
ncbi:MAG TPA: hypothetical protein VEU33_43530 [Archangium sp.]|nr:hypothetical protein [Archangium sp.]